MITLAAICLLRFCYNPQLVFTNNTVYAVEQVQKQMRLNKNIQFTVSAFFFSSPLEQSINVENLN